MVYSEELTVETTGEMDVVDVTEGVERVVGVSGCERGLVNVFVPGATGGVTTIEYEDGLVEDFRRAMERLAPRGETYRHNERWGDGNGHSHVRASLLGPSMTAPVEGGRVVLGTWQQIVVVDFDVRPRTRRVRVTVTGEAR